jgi:DNA repair photolyase
MEILRRARKGRGSVTNPTGRYERSRVVPLQGGEGEERPLHEGGEETGALPTTIVPEAIRTIITRNDSPDVPFDQSVNPYKGCEHGCVYCFARPTHAYMGLSPGLDFETRIFSKPDAARLLREELRRPGYRPDVLALGANTDPYQPAERRLRITREILKVLDEHRHPASIVTKSDLVLRDLDLLRPMAARRLACVLVSVTTLDPRLARRMEPRAATPTRRVETIRELSEAGVPVGVLASPMILGLNDPELERILEVCAAAGALSAGTILLRLPLELKELFTGWLEEHYPLKASRVLHLLRETRSGKLYDGAFGRRMRGTGPHAELLHKRFEVARRRLGLLETPGPLDFDQFRVPPRPGDQIPLFD